MRRVAFIESDAPRRTSPSWWSLAARCLAPSRSSSLVIGRKTSWHQPTEGSRHVTVSRSKITLPGFRMPGGSNTSWIRAAAGTSRLRARPRASAASGRPTPCSPVSVPPRRDGARNSSSAADHTSGGHLRALEHEVGTQIAVARVQATVGMVEPVARFDLPDRARTSSGSRLRGTETSSMRIMPVRRQRRMHRAAHLVSSRSPSARIRRELPDAAGCRDDATSDLAAATADAWAVALRRGEDSPVPPPGGRQAAVPPDHDNRTVRR